MVQTLSSGNLLEQRQTKQELIEDTYPFEIIADYDEQAKSEDKNNTYVSSIWIGSVKVINENLLDITFAEQSFDIMTRYAHNGRGGELSELIFFNGKMYTFEDKTGIIFDVSNNQLIPWVILGDGFGNETNGFKCEWATVKDDHIYVGSNGLENYGDSGEVENHNNFFVKKVAKTGEVFHENWISIYEKIRSTLGMSFPGFIIHEAVMWSPINQKWIFLPRKCSAQSYVNATVDYIGCNKMIIANEDFSTIEHLEIQAVPQPLERGFSSFKFLPDSGEKIIVGLTTVEMETPNRAFSTSVIAFDLQGKILYPETKIIDKKYEGLAFFKHTTSASNILQNSPLRFVIIILLAQILFFT